MTLTFFVPRVLHQSKSFEPALQPQVSSAKLLILVAKDDLIDTSVMNVPTIRAVGIRHKLPLSEKRRAARLPVELRARVQLGINDHAGIFEGKTVNLSRSGACLVLERRPILRWPLRLCLWGEAARSQVDFQANTRLIWIQGEEPHLRCGFRFEGLTAAEEFEIERIVQGSASDFETSREHRTIFSKCKNYRRAKELASRGLLPYFKEFESATGSHVRHKGRDFITFASNNYLGLAYDQRVVEAVTQAAKNFGLGSGGARLISGTTCLHSELEERLAEFVGKEAVIVFGTGYQANVGVVSSLIGRHDVVFCDSEAHASLVDGAFLGTGTVQRFEHNNATNLDLVLSNTRGNSKFILVDGVFSMEGDVCNFDEIIPIVKKHRAGLLVDEAHALGIFGKNGRGTCEQCGVEEQVDLVTGTFSKAFGAMGGFVAGSKEILEFIRYNARSFLFSTSAPACIIAGILKSLQLIQTEQFRREKLIANADRLRNELQALGFNIGKSSSHIIPLIIGSEHRTLQLWRALFERGIVTAAMLPPGVRPNRSLIRISCSSCHSDDDIDRFLEEIAVLGRQTAIF